MVVVIKNALKCFIVLSFLPLSFSYAGSITIGSISSQPADEIKLFQPLVSYLSESLKPSGIDEVKLYIASSIDEMGELMKTGKVSIYLDSPFPSLQLENMGVSSIELCRWKKGVEQYHSVIFVHKDSDIHTLDDLKGKTIAFEEEFSTSSYYIPRASMQQKGYILKRQHSRYEPVKEQHIGYLFSDDDRNTVAWVRKKRVPAGAVNNIKFDALNERFKDELRIIFRSISVPRQVVNFSLKLSGDDKQAIRNALLAMDDSKQGREQLKAFEETKKFEEFPIPVEHMMAPIKTLSSTFK